MRCPSCNHDNPADASFCEECGAKLDVDLRQRAKASSESRGAILQEMWGLQLATTQKAAASRGRFLRLESRKSLSPPMARSVRSKTEGERKTVTALFADIKGSTELMEELDPEEARSYHRSGTEADDRRRASLRRLCRAVPPATASSRCSARRSSTRGMPRGLFGRNGLMAAHSKSVSSCRMILASGLNA